MFVNISSGAQNTWQPPCQQIPDDVLVITARRAQLPEKPFFLLILFYFFFSLQMIHGRGGGNAFPSQEVLWMQLLHCSVRFCQQGDQRDSWNEAV